MNIDLGGESYKQAMDIYKRARVLVPPEWQHRTQFFNALASVPANIAEGTGRKLQGKKYYQNFLLTSRGSALETICWLECLCLNDYLSEAKKKEAQLCQEALWGLSERLAEEITQEDI